MNADKKQCERMCAGTLCIQIKKLRAEVKKAQRHITQLEKDRLTGLLNRHAFEKASIELIEQIKNGKGVVIKNHRQDPSYLALVMVDLDNFKKINDRRGHKVGDRVLTSVAKALKQVTRSEDLMAKGKAARYGGEELILLFRCANEASAAMVGEKVRLTVEALKHKAPGSTEEFKVTASIGVAALPNAFVAKHTNNKVMEELFKLADYSLYAAKQKGKNIVCYTNPDGLLFDKPHRHESLCGKIKPETCNAG